MNDVKGRMKDKCPGRTQRRSSGAEPPSWGTGSGTRRRSTSSRPSATLPTASLNGPPPRRTLEGPANEVSDRTKSHSLSNPHRSHRLRHWGQSGCKGPAAWKTLQAASHPDPSDCSPSLPLGWSVAPISFGPLGPSCPPTPRHGWNRPCSSSVAALTCVRTIDPRPFFLKMVAAMGGFKYLTRNRARTAASIPFLLLSCLRCQLDVGCNVESFVVVRDGGTNDFGGGGLEERLEPAKVRIRPGPPGSTRTFFFWDFGNIDSARICTHPLRKMLPVRLSTAPKGVVCLLRCQSQLLSGAQRAWTAFAK